MAKQAKVIAKPAIEPIEDENLLKNDGDIVEPILDPIVEDDIVPVTPITPPDIEVIPEIVPEEETITEKIEGEIDEHVIEPIKDFIEEIEEDIEEIIEDVKEEIIDGKAHIKQAIQDLEERLKNRWSYRRRIMWEHELEQLKKQL